MNIERLLGIDEVATVYGYSAWYMRAILRDASKPQGKRRIPESVHRLVPAHLFFKKGKSWSIKERALADFMAQLEVA